MGLVGLGRSRTHQPDLALRIRDGDAFLVEAFLDAAKHRGLRLPHVGHRGPSADHEVHAGVAQALGPHAALACFEPDSIAEYESILGSEKKLRGVIVKELEEIKKKYGDKIKVQMIENINYAYTEGIDKPEIRNWKWPGVK